jgi:dTMP kinase
LAAAAILADQVERVVRPALAAGALVVADRFLAVPLAQFGVATDGVGPDELEDLAVWATGRLRPDVSVLLDRAPVDAAPSASGLAGEEHVRVRRLLMHMAAAEPHRYVVVDADGPAHEVAERIAVGLAPLLPPAPSAEATVPTPLPRPSADPATVGIPAGGHASTGYGSTTSAPAHPPSPGSGADTGPIRRAEPLRATPSTADTTPIAARPPAQPDREQQGPQPPNSPKAAP